MITPVPNVLYDKVEDAVSRLYEYEVSFVETPTDKALPGHVYDFVTEEPNKVTLMVAIDPEDAFSYDERVDYVHIVGRITGRESTNKDVMIKEKAGATDLGIPVDLGDKLIHLYGDTFSGVDCNDGLWNSNFIAVQDGFNLLNGMKFTHLITDKNGVIKPIKQGLHHRNDPQNLDISLGKEVSRIPTGGIMVGDYVYVYTMSVRYWGVAGMWHVTANQCFRAEKDHLDEFEPVKGLEFPEVESDRFGQMFPFENEFDPDRIYFVAIPGGRRGNLSLLRVEKKHIEDKSKYELCVGKNKYVPFAEGLKMLPYFILSPNVSEPCVVYNHHLKKWLMASISMEGLWLYTADELGDQFKDPIRVLTHKELVSFYGGFTHRRMMFDGDRRIYLQVSQWSPIYNTSLVEVVLK